MPSTPTIISSQKADLSNPSGPMTRLSDCVQNVVLVANTAKTVAIPAGAGAVAIAATVDFAMKGGSDGAMTFPSGDVAAGSGAVINPTARWFSSDVTDLTFVSPMDGVLSLEWFK